jgi:tight adherence protein B
MIILGLLLFASGCGIGTWVLIRQFSQNLGAYEERYLSETEDQLDMLVAFMSPTDLLRISRAVAIFSAFIVAILAIRTGPIMILVLSLSSGAIAYGVPRLILKFLLYRRRNRFLEQFPDAISMLSNAMKSGLSFIQAIEMVSHEAPEPTATELKIFCKDRQTGKTIDAALDRLSERMPMVDIRIFVMVIKLSNRMGGNVTEALQRLAETIRNRFLIEKKVKSLTADIRTQAVVVCLLPFILFILLTFLAPDLMRPVMGTAAGFLILGIVIVMECIGGFFMWKMSQIKY